MEPRLLAFLEGPDLAIVLVVVLLVFGGSQLPKLAGSLGQAQREFQKGLREGVEKPAQRSEPPPSADAADVPEPRSDDGRAVGRTAEPPRPTDKR